MTVVRVVRTWQGARRGHVFLGAREDPHVQRDDPVLPRFRVDSALSGVRMDIAASVDTRYCPISMKLRGGSVDYVWRWGPDQW